MALDTNTKSSKASVKGPVRSSFDQLMDLYWGGSERRITGLTLRIMGINALCIVILMLGALNFGRYETNMITAKLDTFQTQAGLIADSFSAVDFNQVNRKALAVNLQRIRDKTGYELLIVDSEGRSIIQTTPTETLLEPFSHNEPDKAIPTFKDFVRSAVNLVPNRSRIAAFPKTPDHLPDIQNAFAVNNDLNVWRLPDEQLVLGAAVPIYNEDTVKATLYVLRSGQDIVQDVYYFWQQIFNLFLLTLLATVILSIYLSGLIARPLRQLARTAELIRRKKSRAIEIPDLSNRHDEIGELSLVMRDMTESLWNRLDSIEQFAADVAHELKNPLTSLKSAIETLKIAKKKSDQTQLLKILQHDVERMDRLITDISQASRLDAELSREKHDVIDLGHVLSKIVDRYQTHYGAQYSIHLYLPDNEGLYIESLESRITQVFDNLLDNALSFTPKGGAVSITAWQKGQNVMISVDDEGPGIPVAKLDTIFERFYSERRGDEGFGKHSGLGLAICKQIINAAGGHIAAENKPAGGARFVVTFISAL